MYPDKTSIMRNEASLFFGNGWKMEGKQKRPFVKDLSFNGYPSF